MRLYLKRGNLQVEKFQKMSPVLYVLKSYSTLSAALIVTVAKYFAEHALKDGLRRINFVLFAKLSFRRLKSHLLNATSYIVRNSLVVLLPNTAKRPTWN